MKVLVTVKEVTTIEDGFEIEGTKISEKYLSTDLNEWDDYAIEEAVQLQEEGIADEIVTVTIGPEECEETIRKALAKGANRAVRVWDDTLEDTDLLDVSITSEILRAVVEDEDPDLVLMGVQAADDNFGATGVFLAKDIGYNWAAVVNHLEHDFEDGVATVRRELESGVEEYTDIELPAVLTIQTGINEPRYASLRGIRQAQRKDLNCKDFVDLSINKDSIESRLSLTEMYEPESESDVVIWEGDAEKTAFQLSELLREKGVVG
ncbi:electron transfer flavoprotein subunit beta/FixA family protein [Natrarchaeobius oligotrophus]|uniref:Electron transfer flavoprotein subunit beta/FixA family protein n=1 Tax=Natrarchaeobius chitinivorans TaxID=1679083 RepID=A0A3N6MF14_NATCH|nr:electron transfer flavoprotein subunit beta/FixA family protein [Natrarchaeobius chitinivorans]RQG95270.1 electron transfer flavoprotein subunit beta/FixA family protein [Natrarchaeobius chitinivorans]